MKIFDSHAHYDDPRFDQDRYELLDYLNQNDYRIINIGADIKTSKQCVELAQRYKNVYATVGIHPHDINAVSDQDLITLEELAGNNKVVAIGEIGLDYHYENTIVQNQKYYFVEQIRLAKKLHLPMVIHSRDADLDTFTIINQENIKNAVVHCFSGSLERANQYVKMGLYIGIGGSITFKNAKKTLDVVKGIPIENILIETDAPYLCPEPNRGKRNDSSQLIHVINKIAEIKNMDIQDVASITYGNALKFYRI
ncbi:MAG: hydrolase TatD [Candidatus Epulonipiscioides saccharophilum]|nr:MAG: hydrolase TatD [Epulopiscium sp. AS2M-Bin001]